MTYGPTQAERIALRKRKPRRHLTVARLVIVIAAVFTIALLLSLIGASYGDDQFGVDTAHASEGEEVVVHQNDYYCREIRDKGEHLVLEGHGSLEDLCAKWGLTI